MDENDPPLDAENNSPVTSTSASRNGWISSRTQRTRTSVRTRNAVAMSQEHNNNNNSNNNTTSPGSSSSNNNRSSRNRDLGTRKTTINGVEGIKVKSPYTAEEDKAIIQQIVDADGYGRLKGRAFWIEMEQINTTGRTWQSLKERFRKSILPRIIAGQLKLPEEVQHAFLKQDDKGKCPSSPPPETQRKKRSQRNEYTLEEDLHILKFIETGRHYKDVGGNEVWMIMARTCPKLSNHTWQSLRNRYSKKILPNIHNYNLPKDLKEKFVNRGARRYEKHKRRKRSPRQVPSSSVQASEVKDDDSDDSDKEEAKVSWKHNLKKLSDIQKNIDKFLNRDKDEKRKIRPLHFDNDEPLPNLWLDPSKEDNKEKKEEERVIKNSEGEKCAVEERSKNQSLDQEEEEYQQEPGEEDKQEDTDIEMSQREDFSVERRRVIIEDSEDEEDAINVGEYIDTILEEGVEVHYEDEGRGREEEEEEENERERMIV